MASLAEDRQAQMRQPPTGLGGTFTREDATDTELAEMRLARIKQLETELAFIKSSRSDQLIELKAQVDLLRKIVMHAIRSEDY